MFNEVPGIEVKEYPTFILFRNGKVEDEIRATFKYPTVNDFLDFLKEESGKQAPSEDL